jgi:hypothetical protein
MKGSAALLPNNSVVLNGHTSHQSHTPCPVPLLQGLGFDDGELEMFSVSTGQVPGDQLVTRYLEIARSAPYNLTWQTGDVACVAEYRLGIFNDNGRFNNIIMITFKST